MNPDQTAPSSIVFKITYCIYNQKRDQKGSIGMDQVIKVNSVINGQFYKGIIGKSNSFAKFHD